jgi:Na+-transporting methylmalonyl-CoA/oxaloacetate decarboxylase gamma subunit
MQNMNLTNALWITLIGIMLVFVGILVLWGMMEILVRATQKKAKPAAAMDDPVLAKQEITLKQKAAAVAVVTAICLHKATTISAPQSQQESLSPWQSIHRGYRNPPYSRR